MARPLVRIPVAFRVLAVPFHEVPVVFPHGGGKDELSLADDGITIPVDGEIHEPKPQSAQLALQPVQGRPVRGREVAGNELAHVVAHHADHLREVGFLGFEMVVESPHGQLCKVGDLMDVRLEEPLPAEEALAGPQKTVTGPLLEGRSAEGSRFLRRLWKRRRSSREKGPGRGSHQGLPPGLPRREVRFEWRRSARLRRQKGIREARSPFRGR